MDLGLTVGRFFAGALVTTLIAIGGVWTVVGLAVSGMTSAVEATNARMTDLDGRMTRLEQRTDQILDKLRDIEVKTAHGFAHTQQAIREKAELTPDLDQKDTSSLGEDESDPLLKEILRIVEAREESVLVFLPTERAIKDATAAREAIDGGTLFSLGVRDWAYNLTVLNTADVTTKLKSKGSVTLDTIGGAKLKATWKDDVLFVEDDKGVRATVVKGRTASAGVRVLETDRLLNYNPQDMQ